MLVIATSGGKVIMSIWRKIAVTLLLAVLVGCEAAAPSPAKLDGSSKESFEKSLDKVKAELTPEQSQAFTMAYSRLVFQYLAEAIFQKKAPEGHAAEYAFKRLDGMTAQQVLAADKAARTPSPEQVASLTGAQEKLAAHATAEQAEQPEKAKPGWEYSTKRDEMRNLETKRALLMSNNTANFSFPYSGGSQLGLWLQKSSANDQVIYFEVTRGQIVCHECSLAVKFDDDKVEHFRGMNSDDGDSRFIGIVRDKDFLSRLRKAKKLMVEIRFYQEGDRQFSFDTAGLTWN